MTVLEARGLRKVYDGAPAPAVDDVDLRVAAGEAVSVMGPSGCGKSTLLHLLGGLDAATGGAIHLAGRRVDRCSETEWAKLRRRHIGVVFQAYNLVDTLTVRQNVELPARLGGMSAKVARSRSSELLERLGVAAVATAVPVRLSGGQRQRVAIARALVTTPEVLLADEPTGALDSVATADLLDVLASVRESGCALVLVTHDPRVATTADRLLTMRDGRFVDETRLDDTTRRLRLSDLVEAER
ncbi:MAG TPA: ABC transporter ATP-binding protein [Mycobacteriales bacterium]|nr:ABC transporter ATP-binding protein [Mycobacteriales bacterium]